MRNCASKTHLWRVRERYRGKDAGYAGGGVELGEADIKRAAGRGQQRNTGKHRQENTWGLAGRRRQGARAFRAPKTFFGLGCVNHLPGIGNGTIVNIRTTAGRVQHNIPSPE